MQKHRSKTPQGYHNARLLAHPTEVVKGNSYKDRSTVCFVPSLGSIPVRVIQSWNVLLKPMNAKFTQLFLVNQEVGKAYEQMVDILRGSPDLKTWKYTLTLEHDNCPQPDALLKLYEDIEASDFDAVGALYWCKGEGGAPMCYGRPDVFPKNFAPWLPPPNTVSQTNGLGMGMTLFKTSMLLDEKFKRPMFKTEQCWEPGRGIKSFTQDLFFAEQASNLGYKFGCSTRALCGHYSADTDTMW